MKNKKTIKIDDARKDPRINTYMDLFSRGRL